MRLHTLDNWSMFHCTTKLNVRKRSMYIHISRWHTFDFGIFSCLIVTTWRRWHFGQRWRRFWWMCTHPFVPPARLRILWCAALARKAAICMVLMNHCWVSFQSSLHHSMSRKLNSLLLLFLDFCAMFVYQILRFLYCITRKPSIGHFGHIQCNVHVRPLYLYPTYLRSHGSWHVQNLQEIICCFEKWDSAYTSTVYDTLASLHVFKACFVFFWGRLSCNLTAKFPELTTSSCLILQPLWINVLVDHRDVPL